MISASENGVRRINIEVFNITKQQKEIILSYAENNMSANLTARVIRRNKMSNVSMINGHIDKHEEKNPERDRLIELLDDGCKNVIFLDKRRVNEQVADYLLENGVIAPPKDIGLQKINIKKYENEFDEIAKDLFKIDEDYSGGAKVWVRTDVYKKLMRILALSNHLVKVLKILLTKEEALSKLQASCKQVKGGNSDA